MLGHVRVIDHEVGGSCIHHVDGGLFLFFFFLNLLFFLFYYFLFIYTGNIQGVYMLSNLMLVFSRLQWLF